MSVPRRDIHPRLRPEERAALFRRGIEEFDRGDFFAAHESWEEIWRSTTPEPRDLFQGLIQVAAGLHLYRVLGRQRGARETLAKARRRLTPFGAASHGLDLSGLLAAVAIWEAWIAAPVPPEPPLPRLRVIAPGEVS